ncbi:hypothetical protein [Cupriavidus sp. UYPR2.512]|uniref:hypothetical protein n=1 Tax=Cupriavidus sp. UYPR2.512 TaxID=1080187 RepID=UPI0012FB7DDB|nr:hypothetical protein [Cupriavidus sp. UYPR2.512]UIF89454.1 hypothetical protein KAF44_29745 [Cupriavidus necator]
MNRKLIRKSSASLRESFVRYVKENWEIIAIGAVAGVVAPMIATAAKFPGW